MANQDLHINSALLSIAKPSQKNALTELGRGLKDFGIVKQNQYNQTKQDELTDMKLETGRINMQAIKDTVADNQVIKSYIKSDYGDVNEYLSDNKLTMKTLKAQEQIDTLSDNKMQKFWDDELVANEKYLIDNKKFLTKDGTIDMSSIRKQLGGGSHHLQLSQAFERKYNTNLYNVPKDKKAITISETIAINKYNKEDKKEKDTLTQYTNLLNESEQRYKSITGKPMSQQQKHNLKTKNETPYTTYKDLPSTQKKQIDVNLKMRTQMLELDKFNDEDFKRVAGKIKGNDISMYYRELVSHETNDVPLTKWFKDFTGALSPRDQQLIATLGRINSIEKHELYGAALTGTENANSNKWDFGVNKSPTSIYAAINNIRKENEEILSSRIKHNVIYGIDENDKYRIFKEDTPVKIRQITSREDKIKFLQGN